MTTPAVGAVLGPDLDVRLQLRWALRLAEARAADLLVYQAVEGREPATTEVHLGTSPEEALPRGAPEVVQAIEALPGIGLGRRESEGEPREGDGAGHVVHVRLKQVRCPSFRSFGKLLLADVVTEKLEVVTAPRSQLDATDPDRVRERRLFLRLAPCEVVFCFGLTEENELSRVLVPVASGPHSTAALKLGHALASGAGGALTALRVNPGVGPDAEQVGERRLGALLRKGLGEGSEGLRRRVVVDDQVHRGIRRVWDEGAYDLIVLGASRLGGLGGHFERGVSARLSRGDARPAVVVVSAGSPIRSRLLGVVEGFAERVVPQIDRENRVALVDRIQSSSQWDFDFFALMVLATLIAAIGLIQNSAAVVIGAMLVAPLMTPILGLGLALVQGNPVLARISFRSIGLGLAVSLLVGAFVGLLTPGFEEPTREMLGRGGPGLLDLFVAFASGLAAAYAYARPGLLAALPGVAIAAALVPPIATSGLALSLGNLDLALHALLLFVINMVTIVLASMASLWAVGLRNIKKASRWTLIAGNTVLASVLMLGVFLSVKPNQQDTPKEIPPSLIRTMQDRLGADYRLDSLSVAYDEIGVQLNVRVLGATLAPQQVAREIRAVARNHFHKPVRVRMVTEVAADVDPQPPPVRERP